MQDTYLREITYLRLSVTERCNLRCRYCMPENGVCLKSHDEMFSEEEMILAVRAAAALGIRKVRITGGEPLVKKNIISICSHISAVPGIEEVCLTTNGTKLPAFSEELRRAGVRRINISLDTLHPDKYARITRGGSLKDALAGIDAALHAGFDRVKINTVLIGGFNDDEIGDLAGLTKKNPLDVRFIELMPMLDNAEFGPVAYLPASCIPKRLPELLPEPYTGGVTRNYRFPDAPGTVGLISPVSNDFCSSCSRIRITADGTVKPCLHSADELSLKGLSYDEMKERLKEAILAKPLCHDSLSFTEHSKAGRSMNRIGG